MSSQETTWIVVLVLAGDGRDTGTGNLTLNGVSGADVRWAGAVDGEELDHAVHEVADALRAQGRGPAILPFGGSDACGARGYVACARELQNPGSAPCSSIPAASRVSSDIRSRSNSLPRLAGSCEVEAKSVKGLVVEIDGRLRNDRRPNQT